MNKLKTQMGHEISNRKKNSVNQWKKRSKSNET
jgi:hypothetical protein